MAASSSEPAGDVAVCGDVAVAAASTGELAASLLKKVGHTGESVNAVKRKAANSLGVAHEIDGVTEAQKMAQSSFLTQPGFA